LETTPPDPEGRNYKTACLWEEVLQRDSLRDLLARFLHLSVEERVADDGKKVRNSTTTGCRRSAKALSA